MQIKRGGVGLQAPQMQVGLVCNPSRGVGLVCSHRSRGVELVCRPLDADQEGWGWSAGPSDGLDLSASLRMQIRSREVGWSPFPLEGCGWSALKYVLMKRGGAGLHAVVMDTR